MKIVNVKKNRYVDSVTLMDVREKAMKQPGVKIAEVQMGTPANLEIMQDIGFEIPDEINCNDLLIGIIAESEEAANNVLNYITSLLDRTSGAGSGEEVYSDLDDINIDETGYNLVQISLPGEYAAAEAEKAIKKGLDVFIFSDNVSLEDELRLKELGREKGVLVMGPDCGVGLIDGVALAAGSIVRRGEIGIVGASGSGAQEVACIIEKCGFGVSQIIGTGGHDLFPAIGGITMIEGIKRLEKDAETKVIALVSKLADNAVMDKVLCFADTVSKPVVAVFLGSKKDLFDGHKVRGAHSLEEAAEIAVELLCGEKRKWGYDDKQLEELAKQEFSMLSHEQKYFRGLFCGGTFTEESLIYFSQNAKGSTLYSNLNNRYSVPLENPEVSKGNSILDLGAENFTEKLPHPVFDSRLRVKRLKKELEDDQVAVIMMDFITGPGVDEDPITDLALICKEVNSGSRHVTFISAICGSFEDPQNVEEKVKFLRDSGVIVTGSNSQSTKLACMMMNMLAERT